jgi:DNA-binding transcriptional ArsR family regulator
MGRAAHVANVELQPLEEVSTMRDVFSALADPTRRALLRMLADVDELPLHEMASRFSIGRTAVSKHLTILRQAGLVNDRMAGRETRYRLNAAPLREVREWIEFYERVWTDQIDNLRDLLEEEHQ